MYVFFKIHTHSLSFSLLCPLNPINKLSLLILQIKTFLVKFLINKISSVSVIPDIFLRFLKEFFNLFIDVHLEHILW